MENKFEIARTIAAFLGFFLGLFNLAVSIYKSHALSCKIKLKNAWMKEISPNVCILQINISIYSREKDVFLQSVKICNAEPITGTQGDEKHSREFGNVYKGINKNELENISDKSKKEEDFLKTPVLNYKINKSEYTNLTFFDEFRSIRMQDGYEEISLKNWVLFIEINDKKKYIPFSFISMDGNKGCFFDGWRKYKFDKRKKVFVEEKIKKVAKIKKINRSIDDLLNR